MITRSDRTNRQTRDEQMNASKESIHMPTKTPTKTMTIGRRLIAGLVASVAMLLGLAAVAPAGASAAPVWQADALGDSTVPAGGMANILLQFTNVGDTTAVNCPGSDCTLEARFPAGVTPFVVELGFSSCSNLGTPGPVTVTCTGGSNSSNPNLLPQNGFAIASVDPGVADGTSLTTRFDLYGPAGSGTTRPGGLPCDGTPPGTPCIRTAHTFTVSPNDADFDLEEFDGLLRGGDGEASTRAGATPTSVSTGFDITSRTRPELGPIFFFNTTFPVEPPKDIAVEMPAGFAGVPAGLEECDFADLSASQGGALSSNPRCPAAAQVGLASVRLNSFVQTTIPIYNATPPPNVPARFGFAFFGVTFALDARVRSNGDYGVTVESRNTSVGLPVTGVSLELWGNPADESHDRWRSCPGNLSPRQFSEPSATDPACVDDKGDPLYERPAETAFLRNPTSCDGPQDITAHASSWENPGARNEDGSLDLSDPDWKSTTIQTHEAPGFPAAEDDWGAPVGFDHCNAVPFNPSISVSSTSSEADSPTGLEVEISVPQTSDPTVLNSSDLKDAVVTLPEGFSVNPSSADGLESCTLDEIDLEGQNTKPDCPNASKVGDVEIDTPLLSDPLEGSVYLAEPDDPDQGGQENPFDSLIAIHLVAEGPGTVIKLPGEVALDEDTGQVQATFEDNPQLPFSTLRTTFFDGPRSPIATPTVCGTGDVEAELTPWARPNNPVLKSDGLTIDSGANGDPCPASLADRPFEPTMKAGVKDPVAGAFTPFILQLKRPDGHQELLTAEVSPPEGVSAKLAGVPFCSEADIAAESCGEESRIGTEIAAAGAGPSPFFVEEPNWGRVYLAGPYDPDGAGPAEEAPLSMVIHEPVIAGPFDLDDVTIRAAIYVDPETARLTVVSDEIPQINSGIPLRIREIRMRIDREGFTVAPTDCSEQQVEALIGGSHGAEAELTERFQVGSCGDLPFGPEFDFRADNKDATDRSDHPALDTTVEFNQPDGAYASANGVKPSANIAKAEVTLPSSVILDQDSLETICTREDYADDNCPANTQYGTAVAHSPLLDEPLEGPVYLRASDNPLPDLVADLNGIIDIDLAGEISQTGGKNSRLRTTFETVPDQAVSSFNLKLNGGASGLLVNSQNVCVSKDRRTVDVEVYGQNGKTAHQQPRISIRACERKADRKADRLERKAAQLQKKAKKAERKGNKRKARKLTRKANKKLRQAKRTRRAAR